MPKLLLTMLALGFLTACAPTQQSAPSVARTPDGGYQMTSLKSFEGLEEPWMKWLPAAGKAVPKEPGFYNITDVSPGAVRMTLRYRADWWDGDQQTSRRDRQRAEVKGLGPHQTDGQTFEYATTWRTDPDFSDPANLTTRSYSDPTQKRRRHFVHIFQLKATDGSDGPPLVTISVEEGNKTATVDYWPTTSPQPIIVRTFPWKPSQWTRVAIRIKISQTDGLVMASINDDPFTGVQNVPVFRKESTKYRPKWGLYRAAGPGSGAHDDWVEHRDVIVRKL